RIAGGQEAAHAFDPRAGAPRRRRERGHPGAHASSQRPAAGRLMHEIDLFHEERAEIAKYIWDQEHVDLTTIGIDIGSSTSHLLFARVLLERQSQGLSSRFVVVHRQVLWRSPIML